MTSSAAAPVPTLFDTGCRDSVKITFSHIIAKPVLIGLTYVNAHGEVVHQAQLHGRIAEARPEEGIFVSIEGQAEYFTLPPDLGALRKAATGEYRLRSTGEVVVNPDFISSWTINAKE